MPKYLIEREMRGAGQLSAVGLEDIAVKSCKILRDLGPQIRWVHSYVTADKIYCIYDAANENVIHEHAKRVGFPINVVAEVRDIIDPGTAEK